MKNRNFLLTAFLAVPFFLTSDNVIETDDDSVSSESEEVVAEQTVAESSDSDASLSIFESESSVE